MSDLPFTIFVMLIAGVIMFAFGVEFANEKWISEIIDRDLGLYCPTDGSFAFHGECK